MVPTIPEDGPDLSELALKTLATFDFADQPLLLSFFQQHVLHFCTAEQHNLRRAAIEACSGYLTKNGLLTSPEHRTFPVREIIQTIVFAGVADNNAEIRELAINCLDYRFDSYLVRTDIAVLSSSAAYVSSFTTARIYVRSYADLWHERCINTCSIGNHSHLG
jgi:hypothetical protein